MNVVPTACGALVNAPLERLRAAAAQQLCTTKPHEPPRISPPTLVQCPATHGFAVAAVVGIPRWHARGQAAGCEDVLSAGELWWRPAFRRGSCDGRTVSGGGGVGRRSEARRRAGRVPLAGGSVRRRWGLASAGC